MKAIRIILGLWFAIAASVAAFGQGGTIAVTGEIKPASPTFFPVVDALYVRGGSKTVTNYTDLANIPAVTRAEGMRVYVKETGLEYVLGGDLTTWRSSDYLLTSPQTLSSEQKITVRQNAGVASVDDADGFPPLAGRPELVACGGYVEPALGYVFGMAAPVASHTRVGGVNMGNDLRVNTTGLATHCRLFVPVTLPADCEVWVHVWRKGERWDLIGSSGNLRSLLVTNDTPQTVQMPHSIPCQLGDYIGFELRYTEGSWGAGLHTMQTPKLYDAWTSRDMRWAYSPPMESGANWEGGALYEGYSVPIVLYMQAPVWVIIGDSRVSGYPGSRSLITPTAHYTTEWDMAGRLERLLGVPVRNVGVEGNTVVQMMNRFTNDVLSASPRGVVIYPGGINDMYHLVGTNDYVTAVRTMVDAALTNGVRYVAVTSDMPFWDATTPYPTNYGCIQGVASDERCLHFKNLVDGYPRDRVLWIDLRPDLGQERPNFGDPYWHAGNLWDLKELFISADTDRLHMSPAGAQQMARTTAREVRRWLKAMPVEIATAYARPDILGNAGDADYTVGVSGAPVTILRYNTTLTANRTVTITTTGRTVGDVIRVIRDAATPGAYTLNVAGVATIPNSTRAVVELTHTSAGLIQTGYQVWE